MFVSTITRKWIESSGNRISEIEELRTCGVKGWTIREGQRYGVAIPISEEKCISESFSGARLGTAYILIENQIKIYVLMLICENPNASRRNGTYITRTVAIKLAIPAHVRAGFRCLIWNRLPLCERILKLWNISASDNVTKAIVVPSSLVVISHIPDSI